LATLVGCGMSEATSSPLAVEVDGVAVTCVGELADVTADWCGRWGERWARELPATVNVRIDFAQGEGACTAEPRNAQGDLLELRRFTCLGNVGIPE